MIKFSVLMSVYKEDTCNRVNASIQSLLNQTLRPTEIVIIVDGPIDANLRNLINKYENLDIFKIVYLEKNVGLGLAMQLGILHCSYNYIARMDSDDISEPTRFEIQINYLQEHPEVDVLGGNIDEYDLNMEHKLASRIVPTEDKQIKHVMRVRNAMNHVTVIYKKKSVLQAGNYQNCPFFEDYYLWCRMAKKDMIFHNINETLVKVRAGEQMYKRRGGITYNRCIIDFYKKMKEIHFLSSSSCFKNAIARLIIANIPNSVRGLIYKKCLRR